MSKDDKLRFPNEPRIPTKPAVFDDEAFRREQADQQLRFMRDLENGQGVAQSVPGQSWQGAGFREPQRYSKQLAWLAAGLLVLAGFALGFATAGALFFV